MIKTFAFLIDNLEVQLSIWKSNFILEMAKTISQRLEYFPYTHKKENMDIQIGWKYNINKSSANWNVAICFLSLRGQFQMLWSTLCYFPKLMKLDFQNINLENRNLGHISNVLLSNFWTLLYSPHYVFLPKSILKHQYDMSSFFLYSGREKSAKFTAFSQVNCRWMVKVRKSKKNFFSCLETLPKKRNIY